MDASTESTREFMRGYLQRVWQEQDLDALAEYLPPDPGLVETMTHHLRELFDAFDGLEIAVNDVIVDGGRAAVWATISGVHTGPFAGVAPTGKAVRYDSIRIFQVQGGRLVGSVTMQDRLGLLEQLGVVRDLPQVNWGVRPTAT